MVTSDAYRRCFALFARQDYEACARESEPLIDRDGTQELLQIFLISLYRSGQSGRADDLAPGIEKAVAHDRWSSALLRLTLGLAGPAEVLALVNDARQRCRGCYYIGANQRTHGFAAAAQQAFDASMETGIRCTESDLARLERKGPDRLPTARGNMTAIQFDWFSQQLSAARAASEGGRRGEAL